ncbi:unnamed protein product [Psylliodes chrysocephalus]|uniref:Uncharacterized protein n=1 Tax=Psylliodes chrysocephalus TaxID=3402493 RepID=A0A9P0D082_9CUCU|nr:unnamed protein product [Psylliodes chrysocephala]
MSCSKCKVTESKEEPLTNCDKCTGKYCQTCARLSTTEYRAAILKSSRTLLFLCPNCRSSFDFIQPETYIKSKIEAELKSLRDEILSIKNDFSLFSKNSKLLKKDETTDILKAEILKLKEEFKIEIKQLKHEIINLKESNIDMIILMTNAPASVSLSSRKPLFAKIVQMIPSNMLASAHKRAIQHHPRINHRHRKEMRQIHLIKIIYLLIISQHSTLYLN